MNLRPIVFSLLMSLCGTVAAAQEELKRVNLTVRVVMADDETMGIESKIFRRMHGQTHKFLTNKKGVVIILRTVCDNSTELSAKPNNWQLKAVKQWNSCTNNPLILRVSRVEHSEAMQPALTADLSNFAAKAPEIVPAQKDFFAAIEQGEDAKAAAAANEIAAMLRLIGVTDLATSYGVTAMEGGWRALRQSEQWGAADDAAYNKMIALDPNQDAWVMTPAGQTRLVEFQTHADIPATGRWDWRTFNALEAGYR